MRSLGRREQIIVKNFALYSNSVVTRDDLLDSRCFGRLLLLVTSF